ncbi:MAG: DinB family protein [Acidobacteria bacterium]|nr:DinB family protein [Acidobacteriota bacterium]
MTLFSFADSTKLATRVLAEGYGPGAWHGPDLKAALADVTAAEASRRPAPGRHNIAEIAAHHAFYQHAVRGRLLGTTIEPFPFDGEDWFVIDDVSDAAWRDIVALVGRLQQQLLEAVTNIETGRVTSPMSPQERFDTLLGITCHAVYHAGQMRLVRQIG